MPKKLKTQKAHFKRRMECHQEIKKKNGIHNGKIDVDGLIRKAKAMQKEFAKLHQEAVNKTFLKVVAHTADKNRVPLAIMAVEETKMGLVKDKALNDGLAAEASSSNGLGTQHVIHSHFVWLILSLLHNAPQLIRHVTGMKIPNTKRVVSLRWMRYARVQHEARSALSTVFMTTSHPMSSSALPDGIMA